MNCPACKTPGAYVGFTASECVNPVCVHYKAPAEEARRRIGSLEPPLKTIQSPLEAFLTRPALHADFSEFYEITLRQMPKPCCGFVEVYISHHVGGDKPSWKEWFCRCRKCGQAVSSPVVASEENMAREMNVVANFVIEKWNGISQSAAGVRGTWTQSDARL